MGTCCSIGHPPCSQGAEKQSVSGSGEAVLREPTFSRWRLWVRGSATTRAASAATASASTRPGSPRPSPFVTVVDSSASWFSRA